MNVCACKKGLDVKPFLIDTLICCVIFFVVAILILVPFLLKRLYDEGPSRHHHSKPKSKSQNVHLKIAHDRKPKDHKVGSIKGHIKDYQSEKPFLVNESSDGIIPIKSSK